MSLHAESKHPELKIPHNYNAAEREADKVAEGFKHSTDVRGDVGRRLGLDFSSVKIHEGASAAAKTDSVGAPAMAQGQNIYLGGNVEADSGATRSQVIAHELVHTAQQTQGGGMSESVPAGSTQMWNPFKKKKKKPKETLASQVPSRAGQGGAFKPLSDVQKQISFDSGIRGGMGQAPALINNSRDALSGWHGEVEEFMKAKKTDLFGTSHSPTLETFQGMTPRDETKTMPEVLTGPMAFKNSNSGFMQTGAELLERLLPHLEGEGMQDFIREIYANTGGRDYQTQAANGVKFDDYVFKGLLSKGFNHAPAALGKFDQEDKTSGMSNWVNATGQTIANAPFLLEKKLRGEELTADEELMVSKLLPVFSRIREIGQGSIREGVNAPMTDLSSLLPQQSSPPSYSPPPVPTTAPQGVKQQFGYQQRAQEIGDSFDPSTAQAGDFKAFAYKKLVEAKNAGDKEKIRYWAGIIAKERSGNSVWDDITPTGSQQPAQPSSPAPAKKKKSGWSLFGKKK